MRAPVLRRRWLTTLTIAAVGLGTASMAWGQGRGGGQPTGPSPNVSTDPLLRGFEFRSIGPAVMMGRVDDIQGSEQDPMTIYVGFATGGLWKSTDGGNYWRSLLDNMPNESIGSIAIAPSNKDIVYVGMGEGNNRQSSSIGDGVWGTTDGGDHWTHLGLEETQSIQRVVVDPNNPNIVYVAAVGHLFGPNPERGLYRTQDGGKTWKTLAGEPASNFGAGPIAISADGKTIVWTPRGGEPNYSVDQGTHWTVCAGLPSNVRVVADPVNASRFYAFDGQAGRLMASTNSAATFEPTAATLPDPQGAGRGGGMLAVTPDRPGDLWVGSRVIGLYHSTDGGASFTKLNKVGGADALGFGKAAPGKTFPALYLLGNIEQLHACFRSDDNGQTWVRINDDQHQFGAPNRPIIIGDPRIYGRVYLTTSGRGVIYGDRASIVGLPSDLAGKH